MITYLAIDQFGNKYILTTKYPRKELLNIFYRTHADKMYVDTKEGKTKHVGYIIDGYWLTLYNVSEWEGKQ